MPSSLSGEAHRLDVRSPCARSSAISASSREMMVRASRSRCWSPSHPLPHSVAFNDVQLPRIPSVRFGPAMKCHLFAPPDTRCDTSRIPQLGRDFHWLANQLTGASQAAKAAPPLTAAGMLRKHDAWRAPPARQFSAYRAHGGVRWIPSDGRRLVTIPFGAGVGTCGHAAAAP